MLCTNIKFDIDASEFCDNIWDAEEDFAELADKLGYEVDFEDEDSVYEFCDYLLTDALTDLYDFYGLPTEIEVPEFCILDNETDTYESVCNWLADTYGLSVESIELSEE